jgi:hypothetical protein
LKPTIPVFERAKTVHTLDCAPTVIGKINRRYIKLTRNVLNGLMLNS